MSDSARPAHRDEDGEADDPATSSSASSPSSLDSTTVDAAHQTTEDDPLKFINTVCGRLKTLKRTGWVRSGVPLPESDADHMHRCAMCALLLSRPPHPDDDHVAFPQYDPSRLNLNRLLKMALTHDLCEALAGDVTPFCDAAAVRSKHDKEDAAMCEIRRIVGDPLGTELYGLWDEYEQQRTPEAIYCKDIDKFEMVLQAFEYEERHLKNTAGDVGGDDNVGDSEGAENERVLDEPLRTFFVTTNTAIRTPLFRRLDRDLRAKRVAMLKKRGWDVTNEEKQQENR